MVENSQACSYTGLQICLDLTGMSVHELVEDFCRSLKRRHIEGSLATGKRTAEVLRILITSQRHSDAQSLLDDVRRVGAKIQSAKPLGEAHAWHTSPCSTAEWSMCQHLQAQATQAAHCGPNQFSENQCASSKSVIASPRIFNNQRADSSA